MKTYETIKNRVLWLLVLIMFVISITMGCIGWGPAPTENNYESEVFEEEYYMAPGSIIIIEKYIKGVLDVEGWQGQNVNISAMKKSVWGEEGVEGINIQVIEGDAKLEIKVDFDGDQDQDPLAVRMYIKVPKNVRVVNITTSAGPIHLRHTIGNTTIESRSGNVIVEDVDGIIDVKTSNGFLNVGRTRGFTGLVTSNGDMRINVDDIVGGLLAMGVREEAIGEAINLGSGKEQRVVDMARKVNDIVGNEAGIVHVPRRDWDAKTRLLSSIEKAKRLLDYKPQMTFEDGLERVHGWFVENWADIERSAEFQV